MEGYATLIVANVGKGVHKTIFTSQRKWLLLRRFGSKITFKGQDKSEKSHIM